MNFPARWHQLLKRLGYNGPREQILYDLMARYKEAGRYYHTIDHVHHCLNEFDRVRDQLLRPDHVELALWFHDIVYCPGKAGNEEDSAAYLLHRFEGLDVQSVRISAHHVLATVPDMKEFLRLTEWLVLPPDVKADARADAEYVHDIDFSILGQPRPTYQHYAEGVCREHACISRDVYNQARVTFLRHLLDQAAIFATTSFQDAYEHRARDNIQAEITWLGDTRLRTKEVESPR